MLKAVICVEGKEIEIPGLSELIEKAWTHRENVYDGGLEQYERIFEKGPNGNWQTIYKKKATSK